jgi:hypothetical protein
MTWPIRGDDDNDEKKGNLNYKEKKVASKYCDR